MKPIIYSLFFFSFIAIDLFAIESVTATGSVFYKMPSGEVVERKVSLIAPERGQGAVELRYGQNLSARTEHFRAEEKNGRTQLVLAFKNPPGSPAGVTAVFSGSYIRGNNVALYYGDVYGVKKDPADAEDWEAILSLDDSSISYKHTGGFFFKADVKK